MRARISADPGRGPGNGIIEIFDVGDTGEPGFTLLRASDGKSLGPRGWQESETLLTPEAWDNDGGSLRLANRHGADGAIAGLSAAIRLPLA